MSEKNYRQYLGNLKELTWRDSAIREYLNNELVREIFSGEEYSAIIKTEVSESKIGEKKVIDALFLLSEDEYIKYLKGKKISRCVPSVSMYRELKSLDELLSIIKTEKSDFWWLRTSGSDKSEMKYINRRGKICSAKVIANLGIRPAMYIKLDVLEI